MINFIYRVCYYTPAQTWLREIVVPPHFFGVQTMSQSGSGTGSSLNKDDMPILSSFQNRKSEFGSWRTGLSEYVSRMRELCPEDRHPDEEWLNKGFAMISLDQGQEVATQDLQGAVGIGGQVPEGKA